VASLHGFRAVDRMTKPIYSGRLGHARATREPLDVRVYAVITESSDEAVEVFVDRQMVIAAVENWDRNEPDRAGEVWVEPVELEMNVLRRSCVVTDSSPDPLSPALFAAATTPWFLTLCRRVACPSRAEHEVIRIHEPFGEPLPTVLP
jgi:hypothetical protein